MSDDLERRIAAIEHAVRRHEALLRALEDATSDSWSPEVWDRAVFHLVQLKAAGDNL